jgi:universal stress protein A
MATYKHILLAVDFTPEVGMVTRKGWNLAELSGAKSSLVHVVEYSSSSYPSDLPLASALELDDRLKKKAEVELKELAITHGFSDAKRYVELGVPKQEIVRIAEEKMADLIVIGSHGRHGIQRLLGSTANGVLHLAKCDVLAVRIGA